MGKIVIIEDDITTCKIIESVIEKFVPNTEIKSYTTAEEAWEVTTENPPPQLIILDIHLPKMEGGTFCKKIRQYFPDPPPFIIAISSDDSEKILPDILENGANDFIQKPITTQTLLSRITIAQHQIKKQQNPENKTQTEILNSIIQNIPYPIILMDREHKIKFFNRQLLPLLARKTRDLLGLDIRAIIHPGSHSIFNKEIEAFFSRESYEFPNDKPQSLPVIEFINPENQICAQFRITIHSIQKKIHPLQYQQSNEAPNLACLHLLKSTANPSPFPNPSLLIERLSQSLLNKETDLAIPLEREEKISFLLGESSQFLGTTICLIKTSSTPPHKILLPTKTEPHIKSQIETIANLLTKRKQDFTIPKNLSQFFEREKPIPWQSATIVSLPFKKNQRILSLSKFPAPEEEETQHHQLLVTIGLCLHAL